MNTSRNRTYQDVAQAGIEEYAETVLSEGIGYGSTARSIAAAAWDAMVDALVEAGADLSIIQPFLNTEVEDYVEDVWDVKPDLGTSSNADLLKQAAEILLKVAESL